MSRLPEVEPAGRANTRRVGYPGAGLAEGDLVVVDGAWGDETCPQCLNGNQGTSCRSVLVYDRGSRT